MARNQPEREPVSDARLIELSVQMKCRDFELGPLDQEDIRKAVLELYQTRKKLREQTESNAEATQEEAAA